MRRLTKIDQRRDMRNREVVADLRCKAENVTSPEEREHLGRLTAKAESLAKWDRVFPLGLWFYFGLVVAWIVPWAFIYRAAGTVAGLAYLAAYPVVLGLIWLVRRGARSGSRQ